MIHFLNNVIKPETPITSVEIANVELPREYVDQKGARLDINVKTQSGELIIVEMQRGSDVTMVGWALFYWSKRFSGQVVVGDKYDKLKRTVSISILDFRLFHDERYWRNGSISDNETKEKMTDLLEMHFFELNKLQKVDKKSPASFWIEFFRDPYSEETKALCEYVPEIREAKEIYEKAKSDPKVRELIDAREKAIRDYCNDISCAEDRGELKGKREVAIKMLKKGSPVEDIADLTELSVAEIESLKAQAN